MSNKHSAELFQNAARTGEIAANYVRSYLQLLRETPAHDWGQVVAWAVERASDAASIYHEAQREAGECPMCGAIYTDPWGGRHYNNSVGCCIEPPEPDGECFRGGEAAAYEREQMAAWQRLK